MARAAPHRRWTLDAQRIRFDNGLIVSVQRTWQVHGDERPVSYGLVPIATILDRADTAVTVDNEEAFWLGLESVDRSRPVALRVKTMIRGTDRPLDALSGGP